MKHLFVSLVLIFLAACSSTVTTTIKDKDGKDQKVEMSEEAFIENQRLQSNMKIVDKQVNLIDKGREKRQEIMSKPLVKFQFTSVNCATMPSGNCSFEVGQPVTTEMLNADAKATTAQLAQIKTIKAPTNFNDVLKSGVDATGKFVNTVAKGAVDKAEVLVLGDVAKTGIRAAKELGIAATEKVSNIDNSVTTTDRHDIVNQTDVDNDKSQILTDVDNDKSIITQTDFDNDKSITDSYKDESTKDSGNDNSVTEIKEAVEPIETPVVVEETDEP